MHTPVIELRPAANRDLPAINAIVEAALMTWDLPERVKRLALPGYRYDAMDLQHLHAELAVTGDEVIGMAAWEPAQTGDCPAGQQGLLLHGLYVHPGHMQRGVGQRLLEAAREAARAEGYAGVLVKAQSDAAGFFRRMGLREVPVEDTQRHYGSRYWLAL